jgi:nicotinamide mononucleotide transporter
VYIVLAIRENPWCWPFGIANAVLFLFVFTHARIYGAAALQVVYVVVSVYGWYEWLHGGAGHGPLEVSRAPAAAALPLALAGLVVGLALGLVLRSRTDAALPLWDAGTASFSLVAQAMQTRKWWENWIVWIAVDVVLVGMYLAQGLYPTAALYAVYLGLAVAGLARWHRSLLAAEATR